LSCVIFSESVARDITKFELCARDITSVQIILPTCQKSHKAIPSIEKLKGRKNNPSWNGKFAMTALLEHEDLWKLLKARKGTDSHKLARKAKLILCIDSLNYIRIFSLQ